MASNLNVFVREKINEMDTQETVFEYSTDYTIKHYSKRQLYVTGSYTTTLATFGTQSQGDFETMVYGRISNIDTYDIDVKLVNVDDDLAIFTLGAGEHLMLPNQNFSNSVGSTEALKRIEAKVASGSSRKIKVEYFFASQNEDI